MKYFYRRLRNRKGFTIMELIVVVAIIGILLAMILPGLFSSDKPTKAKGYAKSYFYTVQDFASRMKIAEDPDNPIFDTVSTGISRLYVYTTVDNSGTVVESGIVSVDFTNMTDSVAYAALSAPAQQVKDLITKFARTMEQSVTTSEYAGTFYALIDSDYVVRAAYWADGLVTDMRVGNTNLLFEDDDQISGYLCCAYPAELSQVSGVPDRAMFKYIY